MAPYIKAKTPPPMPSNAAPHIIERLTDLGITEAAGMGAVPVSWQSIDAWCRRAGVDLPPWEARLLRRLSSEYLTFGKEAESETCPPPWFDRTISIDRDKERAMLESVLG